jgi:hypothetical protein
VADWSVLTDHARALLCIARDPGVRLRDIAARTGVTSSPISPRPGTCQAQGRPPQPLPDPAHLPLPETNSRKRTIGDILALLTGADDEATA